MKVEQELRRFFEESLLPDLRELEAERLRNLRILAIEGAVGGILAGLAALAAWAGLVRVWLVIVVGLLAIVWVAVRGAVLFRGFTPRFKQAIIAKLVRFIDPQLSYAPGRGVSESVFQRSEIYQKAPDRYGAEDLVQGQMGATELSFSEVHAEYKTESTDSKGRRQTHWHTIFKGLFFVADFHKDFRGRTFVLTDVAERTLGFLGQMLQSWNPARAELVKLEDPEFEKEFVVYADDQIKARYILSTSFMERILAYRQKTRKSLQLSFVRDKVFVAIPESRNLFEPRLFRTMLDFSLVEGYLEDLRVATDIVEGLALNVRIWGKQPAAQGRSSSSAEGPGALAGEPPPGLVKPSNDVSE